MHSTVFLIRSICNSQKQEPHACAWGSCFCVGTYLSSRAASSQVLSAPVSLTAVFGMGTGVPSPSSAPTISICRTFHPETDTSNRQYPPFSPLQNAGCLSPQVNIRCVRPRRTRGPSKPDKAYEIMLSLEQRIPAPHQTVITPFRAPLKDSSISLTP